MIGEQSGRPCGSTGRRLTVLIVAGLLHLMDVVCAHAQSVDFKGELAAAVTANDTESNPVYASFRYVPELYLTYAFAESKSLDVQVSADATSTTRFESIDWSTTDADIDAYRLWLRLGTAQSETRIGLQKISFGAAALIRPLMWFDSIDPRDPLQITDGVWGLLFRYYFINNANVWIWGLMGNDEPKGWERFPSTRGDPELGGRVQLPVPRGEVGFSYHHRTVDAGQRSALVPPSVDTTPPEHRVGLDGKWDVKLGIWLEGAVVHQNTDLLREPYQHLLTIGVDYTFNVGDGLTVLAENFVASSSEKAFGSGSSDDITGLSVTYLWGLLDSFGIILYYDYDPDELYGFFDWRRRYDRWSWHVIAFANPDEFTLSFARPGSNLLAGRGLQLLVVLNH